MTSGSPRRCGDPICELFAAHPKITRVLDTVIAIGLGTITLGQPATTLSGGDGGGAIVAEGTPEQVAAVAASFTGADLAHVLGIATAKAS